MTTGNDAGVTADPRLPGAARAVVVVQLALVALTGVAVLLTVVLRDELVEEWTLRHPSGAEPPAFGTVAVVLFVTFALLAAVLLVFFRGGHPSARVALTLLAAFFLFTAVVLAQQSPPPLFVVMAVACGVLDVLLVVLLWRPATTAFLRSHAPLR